MLKEATTLQREPVIEIIFNYWKKQPYSFESKIKKHSKKDKLKKKYI